MRWAPLVFVLVVTAIAVWLRVRPTRKTYCTVYELGDHLTRVLNKLLDKGEGFAVVETGKYFLQFCPRPVGRMTREGGILIVDVPVQQFGGTPSQMGRDELVKMGFKLREAGPGIYAYQKHVPSAWDAKMVALEVFYKVFGWADDDLIILTENYQKAEKPRED